MTSTLAQNFKRVNEQIAEAVLRARRPEKSVSLIAVSKTHPASAVVDAVRAGQRVFGENRVQEALDKQAELAGLSVDLPSLEWHLIGHLQTNKVKFVPGAFQWVHTVDSLALARRISDAAHKAGTVCNVLVQVNVADDPAKFGIEPAALVPLVESLLEAGLPGVALRGLMTIGKLDASEIEARRAFSALRVLRDTVRDQFALPGFTELSMGMSGDFPLAIAEGATLIRVGSALFGERQYPPAA